MRLSQSLEVLACDLSRCLPEHELELAQVVSRAPSTDHWTSLYVEVTPTTPRASIDVLASISLSDANRHGVEEFEGRDAKADALLTAATSAFVNSTHLWFEFDAPATKGFSERRPCVLVPLLPSIDARGVGSNSGNYPSALERARFCCAQVDALWSEMLEVVGLLVPHGAALRNASFMLARRPRLLKLNFECSCRSLLIALRANHETATLLSGSRLERLLASEATVSRFQLGIAEDLRVSSIEAEAHVKPSGEGVEPVRQVAEAFAGGCHSRQAVLDLVQGWSTRKVRARGIGYSRFLDSKIRLDRTGQEDLKIYLGQMEHPFPF